MTLSLTLSAISYCICRLPANAPMPTGFLSKPFFAITRTKDELSIVLPEKTADVSWRTDTGWRMLKVEGPLDFDIVGVVATLSAPLAEAGIPIFVISTFDTDYLLIKKKMLEKTLETLESHGHTIIR